MSSMADQLSRLVYSTEKGRTCSGCGEALDACRCEEVAEQARVSGLDGVVRIRREVSGRKGKGVTTITGVPLVSKELEQLAKELKKQCGTGGTLKDAVIEIQGDHRDKLKLVLEKKGFKVKLSGG